MKLLLDENLSRRLVPFLQAEFPDSTQVALAGLERATDLVIWTHARDHGYVIVTRDADFEELSTIHGCPPQIIWIRGANISKATILNLLLANRDVIEAALTEDGIACVELGSSSQTPDSSQRGFTLIELAIVMFIVALLLGGMLLPLSAQQDVRSFAETQKNLALARDALLGFAMANDRLPCPATSASNGVESPAGGGVCTNAWGGTTNGYLPAVTLGLSPVDTSGYFLDGWGGETANRIRYAITTSDTSAFSTSLGMKNTGMTTLAPDLIVCSTSVGMSNPGTASAACAAGTSLATDAVAVIYSLGKNAGSGGAGTEETHNPNPLATITADPAFINTQQGTSSDDQMLWISKNTLFNRLVTAGRLP